MPNDIIINLCPLCGHIGVIHPGESPDPLYPESGYRNRCAGHKLTDKDRTKQGTKSRGTETVFRARDASKTCRFPFTDQDGKTIERRVEYRESIETGESVAVLAARILSDHSADSALWY